MMTEDKIHLYGILIVIFAIVMMLSSALVSYFLVMKNEPILASLKMEIENKQVLIRDIWNNINNQENKADTLVIISLLANNNNTAAQIKDFYLKEFPELNPNANILDMLTTVAEKKAADIETINNLYIEQTAAQHNVAKIEQANKSYSSIAFFLQGLGLLLIILKRDILGSWRRT